MHFLKLVGVWMVAKRGDGLDFEQVKANLLGRKAELETVLADLSSNIGEDPQGQDLGDQALSSSMESLRQSLQNTEQLEYRMILEALQAVEDGSYGICIDCEGQISDKRLKHYPNAARCITCQESIEEQG